MCILFISVTYSLRTDIKTVEKCRYSIDVSQPNAHVAVELGSRSRDAAASLETSHASKCGRSNLLTWTQIWKAIGYYTQQRVHVGQPADPEKICAVEAVTDWEQTTWHFHHPRRRKRGLLDSVLKFPEGVASF